MNFTTDQKLQPRILLVEDNRADIRLTQEALKESAHNIHLDVVTDGEEALNFLLRKGQYSNSIMPHIILLDLNLPKKTGLEVLQEIKVHAVLKKIPVILLTTSDAEHDIAKAYNLHANCYILKPVDFEDFSKVIKLVETYWFNTVQLSPA
jgi:two-component system, chemotaxis family, response regulator Rcp1